MRRSSRNDERERWVALILMLSLWKGSSSVVTPPPDPTVPPPAPPPGAPLTLEQLKSLARMVGFADVDTAAAIAMAESRGFPGAKNISLIERSFGLWQINTRAHPEFDEQQLLTPAYNARAALVVSHGGTVWTAWTTFNTGAYRQWMGASA